MPGAGKFFASPVAGDGKVYVSDAGNLNVIKAASTDGDAAWNRSARRPSGERAVATPGWSTAESTLRTELCCIAQKQFQNRLRTITRQANW